MKLNFIQNLSDEVLRQNYQLKSQIQQVKQQLNDYEIQMVEVISNITPNKNVCINPKEILQEFIKIMKQELIEHKSLKHHTETLRKKYEELQKEEIKHLRLISQKSIEMESFRKHFDEQTNKNAVRERQLQNQVEELHQCNHKMIQNLHELKIEKLKMEESKRKEVEQLRQVQNTEIINFRERNEKQHMRKEKQLKKEVEMREKTIKEMSKSLAELTNSKNIQNSETVLADIFKSFQSFQDLTQTNKELKDENQELRQQIKQLYNRLIALQANLQECKSTQYDLQSRLERIVLEKQQIENNLVVKINQMERSEKDKEALQQYYDQKWNSEYKKVKIKLEKAYSLKIAQLQEQSQLRMVSIQNELREMIQQKKYFHQRNSELEIRFNYDQKEKESLNTQIQQLIDKNKDLLRVNVENSLMFQEEIHIVKLTHEEEKVKFREIIKKKEESIQIEAENLINCRIKHFKQTGQLQDMYETEIAKQTHQFNIDRQALVNKYTQELTQLKSEIFKQIDSAEVIRKDIQKQFQSTLQTQKVEKSKVIAQMEAQYAKNNERWIDKYRELQNLLAITRRKYEDQIKTCKRQKQQLLENYYSLLRDKEALKQQITSSQAQIAQFLIKIQQKEEIIAVKQQDIQFGKKQLMHSKNEVEVLLSNRKLWRNQLLEVERQFQNEFDELKKMNEKQINLYKNRILELQNMNRQSVNNKKAMEKVQNLQNERHNFKAEIHIKQAENIILSQVKDYYETKLKETEGRIGKNQFKTNHAILARKLKKNRIYTNQSISQRMFEPREHPEKVQMKRYSNSVQKQYNPSLSKAKFDENYQKIRVQTMSSFK